MNMNALNPSPRDKSPSRLSHLIALAAILLSAIVTFSHGRAIDPDFWGQLAFGKLIVESRGVPQADVYSYMPVKELWVNHEWGAAVIFHWIYKNFGGPGIIWFKMIIWMSITALCYSVCRRENARPVHIILVYFICFQDFFIGINSRPHLFTYLFFTVFLWAMSRYEKRPNLIFFLPLVNILWANTHGGVAAGLGILGLFFLGNWYASGKIDFRTAAAIFLCLLTPLINPYGLNYYKYLLPAVLMDRWYIGEWRPLDLADFDILNNYKILLAIAALGMALLFERKKIHQYLIIIFSIYVSLKHVRHTPFFFISAMAFLPGILSNGGVSRFLDRDKFQSFMAKVPLTLRNISATAALLVLALMFSLNSFVRRFSVDERIMDLVTPVSYKQGGGYVVPRMMVNKIRKLGLEGNIAVEFAWGEYIIWELGDRCRVSIDGRLETVYTRESIDAYFDFVNAREGRWRNLIDKYPTDMALIRVNCPVYEKMLQEKGWELLSVYYDSALFVRAKNK
ncbi:MAG: hypothetical protein HZA01_09550 [Nitrospinae bacterium]|nr:hypothetical protein [Nitrospinota bacterium]